MIFGSEPPLCLRRVGRRGLRRHEADVLQHPPGYAHPLVLLPPTHSNISNNSNNSNSNNSNNNNNNSNNNNISSSPPYELYAASPIALREAHRLHPTLTAAAELQHDRRLAAQQRSTWTMARRQRQQQRSVELTNRREEEFQKEQTRSAQMAGVSLRNETGDGRDTITRAFRTEEARRESAYRAAVAEHNYFVRQRKLIERGNPHGYNIVTGEPLRPVGVPPLPQPLLPPINNV